MAATHDEIVDSGASVLTNGHDGMGTATHEPGLTKKQAKKAEVAMPKVLGTRTFENKYEEREYQKGRLVLAFRIFAKLGFDEGVAGHITLRVGSESKYRYWEEVVGSQAGYGGVIIWLTTIRILSSQQVFGSTPLVSRGHS